MPIIFDFCGTIYKGNTTLQFLKYLFSQLGRHYKVRYLLFSILARAYLWVGGNGSGYMKIRVRCLRGIPIAKIQELARPYLERMERTGALTSIFNIFAGLIERKETCYILSGTLDSIAQAFRERHDSKGIARIACSSLEVNEKGRSTGRYKTFMFDQGKVVHGIAAFGEQVMRNATYYTDNLAADKDVCAYVKKVIHVGVMTE